MTQPTGTDSTTALAARFEQAVKDESPSAVAALFADDGSMWLVDDNAPDGATFQGRAGVEEAFAGIFAGVQLDLAIGAPSHAVAVDEAGERRLESGVLARTIRVRESGVRVQEHAGYVRMVRLVEGTWKYEALSVVVRG